jgi:hypothetical protein
MKAYKSAFALFFIAAVQMYGQQATADALPPVLLPGAALSGSMTTSASAVTCITGDPCTQMRQVTDSGYAPLSPVPFQFSHSEAVAGLDNPSQGTVRVEALYALGLSPSLSVSGYAGINSALNGFTASAQGTATLTYQMIIGGPLGAVPVQVHALLEAGVGPWAPFIYTSNAYASFAVQNILLDSIFEHSDDNGFNLVSVNNGIESFGAGAAYTEDGTYTFYTDTIYTITLSAFGNNEVAGGPNGEVGAQTWHGLIDPTFTINGPNANLYSIQFSPGSIGDVAEPSTWAMMLLGFAGVGFVAFRQKAAAAFAV